MFDHHCKWLNNCIGAKNYIEFVALVIITEIWMIFHLTFNLYDVIVTGTSKWFFYLEIITVIVDVIILIFVSILLGMHIYLIVNKKTTVSLIMERRKNNKIHPSNLESNTMEKSEENS